MSIVPVSIDQRPLINCKPDGTVEVISGLDKKTDFSDFGPKQTSRRILIFILVWRLGTVLFYIQ